MKKLLFAILGVLLAIPIYALDFTYEGLKYSTLTDSTVEVAINSKAMGNIVIPEKVVYDNTIYTVTFIGHSAFLHCSSLTSVIIPNSVTSVGIDAFKWCTSLIKSAYPNTISNPFNNGTAISYPAEGAVIEDRFVYGPDKSAIYFAPYSLEGDYVIPNSVETIGEYAFCLCRSLTSVEIGNSVKTIGRSAFNGCSGLTSVEIGNSVKTIGEYAFSNCSSLTSVVLPNSVTTIGNSAFYGCSGLTSVEIPNSVATIGEGAFFQCSSLTSVVIPNSVTTIGNSAFYGCSGLTSVEIGNSVTTIGSSIFSKCHGLTSFTVADGETTLAFEKDALQNAPIETLYMGRNWTYASEAAISTGLKKVTLGDQVTTLPDYAFKNCTGLTSVIIPNSVETIGQSAFDGCSSLASIQIGNSVKTIGNSAFDGCSSLASIQIGNSVKTIGNSAFFGCRGLASVEIPNSVRTIGDYAFSNCTGLSSVEIPNSVATIGKSAFSGCSSLTSVKIPNSVETIGEATFYNCSGLTSVEIPNSVKTIGTNAFNRCSGLTSVVIGNSVSTIGSSAFSDCDALTSVVIGNSVETIGEEAFGGCSGLTSVVIPKSVKSIGNYAFSGCSSLGSVEIGNSVKTIGNYAFSGCSSLGSVEIGNSVKTIGNNAFNRCSGLTSVKIPNSVETIGKKAFSDCSGLTLVKVAWQTPLSISLDVFSDDTYKNATLDVPDNTILDYMFTTWENFLNISMDGTATKLYSDDVFKYRLIENEARDAVLINGNYSSMTEVDIPWRFTDDSDPDNPVRYFVTAIGPRAFKDCTKLTSLTFNSRSTLRTIGRDAFSGCEAITEVKIPATVTEIGSNAFYKCSGLKKAEFTSIETLCKINFADGSANPLYNAHHLYIGGEEITEIVIPNGIEALNGTFAGGSYLASVEIPNSVQTIGNDAFFDCKGLTSIVIPASVETIGESAFLWCDGLKKAEFASIEALCKIKFANVYANPLYHAQHLYIGGEEVTDIKVPQTIDSLAYTFVDGCSLTSMFIPKSVNYIGESTFLNCSKLINFEVEDCNDLLELGIDAFKGASVDSLYMGRDWSYANNSYAMLTSLKSVKLSDNVTAIPDNAFYGCKSLTEIGIPASVDSIGKRAFYNCSNLDSVALVDSEKAIAFGENVFTNTYIKKLFVGRPFTEGYFRGNTSIKKLIIGNMMTEINEAEFKGCEDLKTLTLGSSLVTIGDEAFSGCTALTEVIVPPSVETIGESAFAGNSKLESIIMGHNVKTIGANAYKDAPAKTVSITAQVPPTAPNTTFSSYTGKLWLQDPGDESVMNAYLDALTCWDRFDSYAMVTPDKIEGETQEIKGVPGETFQLTAKVWPENVTLPQVFWRSTNPDIATVDENGLVTIISDISDIINSRAGSDEEVRSCKIIAETLYADGPVLEVTVYDESSAGIDEIVADKAVSGEIDYDAPYEIYNLNGMYVGDDIDALGRGFYIVRQGRVAKKTAIN